MVNRTAFLLHLSETLLGSLGGLDGLDQLGNDLEQVAGDAVIGNLEDGSGVVLVDGDRSEERRVGKECRL